MSYNLLPIKISLGIRNLDYQKWYKGEARSEEEGMRRFDTCRRPSERIKHASGNRPRVIDEAPFLGINGA